MTNAYGFSCGVLALCEGIWFLVFGGLGSDFLSGCHGSGFSVRLCGVYIRVGGTLIWACVRRSFRIVGVLDLGVAFLLAPGFLFSVGGMGLSCG